MSFFRDEPVVEDARATTLRMRMQSVMSQTQPPDDELGVAVPIVPMVLLRNDDLMLAIAGIEAFSTGFVLRAAAMARRPEVLGKHQHFGMHPRHGPGGVQLGVMYDDGRRGETSSGPDPRALVTSPERIFIMPRGGHGGPRRLDQSFWIYPLPRSGPITFIARWSDVGLDEQRQEMDSEALLAAAANNSPMWPRDHSEDDKPKPEELEDALLSAVARQLDGVDGVRVRGVLFDGRHPNTNIVIAYDTFSPQIVGQELRVAVWDDHDASLASRSPIEVGAAIAMRLREVTD
jgi:hypothetical protein